MHYPTKLLASALLHGVCSPFPFHQSQLEGTRHSFSSLSHRGLCQWEALAVTHAPLLRASVLLKRSILSAATPFNQCNYKPQIRPQPSK